MLVAAPSCIFHTSARSRARASTVTLPAAVPTPAPSTIAITTPIPPGPSKAPAETPPAESKPLACEPEHKGYLEMPARTQRNTCALGDASRELCHRYGLHSTMDYAAQVAMLSTRQSIDEVVRIHCTPNISAEPTACTCFRRHPT